MPTIRRFSLGHWHRQCLTNQCKHRFGNAVSQIWRLLIQKARRAGNCQSTTAKGIIATRPHYQTDLGLGRWRRLPNQSGTALRLERVGGGGGAGRAPPSWTREYFARSSPIPFIPLWKFHGALGYPAAPRPRAKLTFGKDIAISAQSNGKTLLGNRATKPTCRKVVVWIGLQWRLCIGARPILRSRRNPGIHCNVYCHMLMTMIVVIRFAQFTTTYMLAISNFIIFSRGKHHQCYPDMHYTIVKIAILHHVCSHCHIHYFL